MNKIESDIIRQLNFGAATMLNVVCAFRAGKQVFEKLLVKTNLKNKSEINRIIEIEKNMFGDDLIEVIIMDELVVSAFGPVKFEFVPNLISHFKKLSPVSAKFSSFLMDQNIKEKLLTQIDLPKIIKEEHFLFIVQGVYCDDEFGAIDGVIYGAATRVILKWFHKENKQNIYPSDTDFDPDDIYFEVPKFDPTAFINYVDSLKKQPKFFNDLQLGFKVREKMNTYGEDYLEIKFKFLQKDKNIVEATIEKIKDFIEERKTTAVIEEHMREEYFRYFKFKDIKADSFTFDLDLGTGDIEELHNIFYLLDETKNIKSVNVTLK